jgi:hypothetical protein
MAGFLFPRRPLLVGLLTCAASATLSGRAAATTARALTLRELTRASARVVRGTPVERFSTWETTGGRRRIVSHTRLVVAEDLARPGDAGEVMVLTWGGRVGDVAQIAHGEAALQVGEESVLFLGQQSGGEHRVTAMAQGHYPLERRDGALLLRRSPQLRLLRDATTAGAPRLAARRLTEAADLIREALR